jgi:UDP-N-acetylmuramate dehydrogenase
MKDFYDGALIEVRFKSSNISILGAYELLGKVNSNYVKQGISSLLFLTLVPSSVGGAICMNAGAYNKEMKDVIEWVYFYDFDENKIKVYDNKSCQFSYRNSYFKNHRSIILGCKIKLEYLEKNLILNNMKDMIEIRKNKLPYEWPSLGSVFKNLDKESVGKIIDECGLKVVRVGGAMVSYKHANVIVNIGHCNREDIIRLIGLIREKVYEKYHNCSPNIFI